MGISYEKVLVDVVHYKYLCDEGFLSLPPTPLKTRWQENGFFRHLVNCIVEDTGMAPHIAERGLIHSALVHRQLDERFFEAVVGQLYA